MDESACNRVDRLERWIKLHRKDLCSTSGKLSPTLLAKVEGLNSNPAYWSDVLRKAKTRSFAASSARETEAALDMPYLYLEGAGWPFEDVDFERWDRLTERQKGHVEKAINAELDRIEAEKLQANGPNR